MAHEILLFLTWRTQRGVRLHSKHGAEQLGRLLELLAGKENARVLELAIVPDHVHLIVNAGLRPDAPRLLQRLKGGSAYLMNKSRASLFRLRWASGYDLRSVSRADFPRLVGYFDRQGKHHHEPWVVRVSNDPNAKGPSGHAFADRALQGASVEDLLRGAP